MAENNGYQQSIYAGKFSSKGTAALDKDGNFCSESGKKQAILLLEGSTNPDPSKYEVVGSFKEGDIIDGHPSMVYNTVACPLPVPVPDFSADKTNVEYPVSRDGLGFDIEDRIEIVSSIDGVFKNYQVQSTPSWVTATKGNTNGVSSILNLVISRNRTDDDERVGSIILVQDGSNQQITISVRQKGRLTEGTPTEYPYVDKDTILDFDYSTAQLGEQIWTRENSKHGGHAIDQARIDNWKEEYPTKYIPTIEEYYSVYGSGYTKENKYDLERDLEAEAGGEDIYKHMIPTIPDVKEMFGFIISKSGGNSWDNFTTTSLGYSLVKEVLDETVDGYDDVRITYPKTWLDALKSGILMDNEIKTGGDKYALALTTPGQLHAFNPISSVNGLYGSCEWHTRGSDPGDPNGIMVYGYSLTTNFNNRGINKKDELSAYFARPVRTLRYRKLPYDIYDNGEEIKKIYNGESVPSGFSVVPKGALRGLWFGNPDLDYKALTDMAGWVGPFIENLNNRIG